MSLPVLGVPLNVVIDNAKEFRSDKLTSWLKNLAAKVVYTPEHHPQSNDCVVRMVQTIKRSFWPYGVIVKVIR